MSVIGAASDFRTGSPKVRISCAIRGRLPFIAAHYFDEAPDAARDPQTVEVLLADLAFTFQTDRGVFSHGHLDSGTAFLLQQAPLPPESGTFVDIGCGAGPIALTLALRSPGACVVAVDPNARARELTSGNAATNGATITTLHPDDVPSDMTVDLIWSNPPIRIGKAALHDLLKQWLPRLSDNGLAVFVVNRHLGADSLHRWLENEGWLVNRLGSRAGFRLLAVQRKPI